MKAIHLALCLHPADKMLFVSPQGNAPHLLKGGKVVSEVRTDTWLADCDVESQQDAEPWPGQVEWLQGGGNNTKKQIWSRLDEFRLRRPYNARTQTHTWQLSRSESLKIEHPVTIMHAFD